MKGLGVTHGGTEPVGPASKNIDTEGFESVEKSYLPPDVIVSRAVPNHGT